MIKINEHELTVAGPDGVVMNELCHGVAEITLAISNRLKVPQDLIIGDVVLGSTLGQYEIRPVNTTKIGKLTKADATIEVVKTIGDQTLEDRDKVHALHKMVDNIFDYHSFQMEELGEVDTTNGCKNCKYSRNVDGGLFECYEETFAFVDVCFKPNFMCSNHEV